MISIEFLMTSLFVILIPGTGVIYTISMGLFQGKKASIFAALGCTAGIIPSLIACVFGLAIVIHTSAVAFQVIKFVGVVYLLYLAWGMWKAPNALTLNNSDKSTNLLSVCLQGFLINILNPKLTLFFLAFLPQFVPTYAERPVVNMLALGGVFMLMTFVVFILYGFLAHSVRHYVIGSPQITKYMQRTFAASFAALGAKLALTER